MPRFALNKSKANNYAFFCPKSRLHLTVSNPVGSSSEVTSAIIRGVKSKSIIDLDGVLNNTAGSQPKAESKAAVETASSTDEKPTAETPKKRGGRKKATATVEEAEASSK